MLSRTGVRYLRCRSWRSETRTADLAALKQVKLELPVDVIDGMVVDLVTVAGELVGSAFPNVVPVACGHSRRPNCLSATLAAAFADKTGAMMVRAFKDRFVFGVSHPKEFDKLPSLEIAAVPDGPCLVVDDVATSGFHIAEAVSRLRAESVPALGIVWVAGIKQS